MTIQEFFNKASHVDFLYSMSDAPGSFDRGRKRVAETFEEAKALGDVYVQIFNDWKAYKTSLVHSTGIEKPKLENYL